MQPCHDSERREDRSSISPRWQAPSPRELDPLCHIEGSPKPPYSPVGEGTRTGYSCEWRRAGLIDTPWTADWAAIRDNVERRAPLRRSGRPEDVAEVAMVLATSTYLTGEVLTLDGGLNLVS